MTALELSRPIKPKALAADPYRITADEAERVELAKRFGLASVEALSANLALSADGADVLATGTIDAAWTQNCSVSGDDFPVQRHENVSLRFVPTRADYAPDEEVELSAEELDDIEFEGDSFDLGEAVAQSLGLMIDPYATGPKAGRIRKEKGIQIEGEQDGPLAEMLSALKKD